MSGTIDLITPASVMAATSFVASVEVKNARPGAGITVELEQRRGPAPRWPAQSALTMAGPNGAASASFSISFASAGDAVLVATAYDRSGTYFSPDAESVEVL
jgi:hypothetical protein